MGLKPHLEIRPLEATPEGRVQFYTPQTSHETMMVHIPPNTIEKLFVHHFQTDQLLVVKGEFVLVLLVNRQYRYLLLSEHHPQVVKIPPGVPHGAINLTSAPCILVNAVLRHGSPHPKDYTPIQPPFPYDLNFIGSQIYNASIPA
ncbi:cupin domain-containing protein [Spirulina sp. CS-785/01]|uniref:cupin domain-containing protein n=1 Tax=Spirulina sp. CS-785/01 TaxID=3021716 RepID=UPI00232EFC03|nr:cupin domain-containing protein [Spirulina sp. CS-785/01]MDB9314539.1 cupin domain-containing protein [Spirulina sp. CS-785/01]